MQFLNVFGKLRYKREFSGFRLSLMFVVNRVLLATCVSQTSSPGCTCDIIGSLPYLLVKSIDRFPYPVIT